MWWQKRELRYHFLLILAEIEKLEYNESDFVEDTVHRQLGYRPEDRLPDIKSVHETQRLDNDNMDYKKPSKNGICWYRNMYFISLQKQST